MHAKLDESAVTALTASLREEMARTLGMPDASECDASMAQVCVKVFEGLASEYRARMWDIDPTWRWVKS